ncbi:MAG: DUF1214 domain-containing protein [Acidimicrobiales bacterium]
MTAENGSPADSELDPSVAWAALVDRLRQAGEKMDRLTADLGPEERADGYRALLRALNNHLGRFETDRERPELVAFNEWREKMLMDNPDFKYWVADIRDDRPYRITGTMGDAAFLSVTVYRSGGVLDARATSRLDSDTIPFDADGGFEILLSRDAPTDGTPWIELLEDSTSVWVRQFYADVEHDRIGGCEIEALEPAPPTAYIDPGRFDNQVNRLGKAMSSLPTILDRSAEYDLGHPNTIRHWAEMTKGAAFTEPGIHYLRGSWQLDHDEALVVEGVVPRCRYWNILLYSRYGNSLDHRHRRVSCTGATATLSQGRYRFALSAEDPGPGVDWLDTEGRPFGMFLMRFLLPTGEPAVPTVSVRRRAELGAHR